MHVHHDIAVLVAVCDSLVLKALERAGNRIVRVTRSRHAEFRSTGLPPREAHTVWPDTDETASKALLGAWEILPLVLERWVPSSCCIDAEQLMNELDCYVHDLVITGRPHTVEDLLARVEKVTPELDWIAPLSV